MATKCKTETRTLFQFKISLKGTKPAIWRRIQVEDCTLDKLHEHIQTAMGWTNSHLHQFIIDGAQCGDPELLDDDFEEFDGVDSTRTKLSKILPKSGEGLAFRYEYDFGDSWDHEIVFEGSPTPEPGMKYPLCVEGQGACPPEDVGGIWGYSEFLAALANPKHERHDELLEWAEGFNPDEFDPAVVTKEMKKGLPKWRDDELDI